MNRHICKNICSIDMTDFKLSRYYSTVANDCIEFVQTELYNTFVKEKVDVLIQDYKFIISSTRSISQVETNALFLLSLFRFALTNDLKMSNENRHLYLVSRSGKLAVIIGYGYYLKCLTDAGVPYRISLITRNMIVDNKIDLNKVCIFDSIQSYDEALSGVHIQAGSHVFFYPRYVLEERSKVKSGSVYKLQGNWLSGRLTDRHEMLKKSAVKLMFKDGNVLENNVVDEEQLNECYNNSENIIDVKEIHKLPSVAEV